MIEQKISDPEPWTNKILCRYRDAPPVKQFLRDGEDRVLVAEITRLRQLLSEAEAALDEREIASGLTSNGNLWRFWAETAKDMLLKLSEAEKREREARAKALEEAAKVAEGKARDFNFQQALADYDDLAVGENGVRIEIADNIRALQSEER